MKAIRSSVFATVLAGLLVPAGIAVATGAVRSAMRPDTPKAAAPQSDAHGAPDAPAKPKPDAPEPKTEPKTEPVKDTTPPSLILYSPEKGSRVTEPVVTVKGAAETGATVKVNGERVETGDHGTFRRDVKLAPGRNLLVIKAYDAAGNRTVVEAAVYYDAPVPEPKPEPTEKPDVDLKDFTANQKFGSSAENPPYDVFFGTGTPGAEVKVKSEYGYVYTTIGKDGTWQVKLFFEGLAAGKTIPVWVKLNGMVVEEFHFTYTP